MKGKFNSLLIAGSIFFLAACSKSPVCLREDVFCAGLVTDTLGLHDDGINQEAWQGLQTLKAEKVLDKLDFIESVDRRDYQKNVDYFVENGYDLIVTAGIGLSDATLRSATLQPDSIFIGINQPQANAPKNLLPLVFAEDQMGFLAGTLAAQLTQTKIVGGVCETSGIASMWRYCEGFRAGVKFTDPSVSAIILYRESGDSEKLFLDEAWGAEQARYLIQRGADVIFAAGGVTAQGALRVAGQSGLYAIGAERNQALALGESGRGVVTSIYGEASFEVQRMVRLIKSGVLPSGGAGQYQFVPLADSFPETLTTNLNLMLKNLQDEAVQTSVSLQKP
ncbi:MAG: BMP family ABC transporter substrate-binding protein [Anaerolineales bacterium]|nr:BMP family ABC transporter substrate-binding protein [Anaerolineales bacterium]